MDGAEKLAKESKIKVAIHNHPGAKNFCGQPETVLAAVKGRSLPPGAGADGGHWVRSALDPVDCLKELEGRAVSLHFTDLNAATPTAHDVPGDPGMSNAKGMLAERKRQHFKGAIGVENAFHGENSAPEIAASAEWFNASWAELAGCKRGRPVG